jgi:hypothetical protein
MERDTPRYLRQAIEENKPFISNDMVKRTESVKIPFGADAPVDFNRCPWVEVFFHISKRI